MNFIDELQWRDLLFQATSEDLGAYLQDSRVAYIGFDPTADSLTIGNVLPVITLARWQRCGHKPIVVMGGATGLIGDPSGKSAERTLLDPDTIASNIQGQMGTFRRLLDFDGPEQTRAVLLNNMDWFTGLSFVDVLRDVGKHFSVNAMIQKDSVSARLSEREQGISYTEFSYMVLQAYDFLHLYREHGCTIQMGGSDQWGNIVSGIDLINKVFPSPERKQAHGITTPLVLKSDGSKMGKSESGAVYVNPDRTSPYALHQYLLNTSDDDAVRFLKYFTFLQRDQVQQLEALMQDSPQQRHAQKALADELVDMLHGSDELDRAVAAAGALFSGNVRGLDDRTLADLVIEVPHTSIDPGRLSGEGVPLAEFLPETTLADSRRQAREFLANSAISVNGDVADPDRCLVTTDILHDQAILIRRGKKAWHALMIS